MRDEYLIMTLAKVLIASAWADGELTNDEINCVKDLMFSLPQVSGTQWAELDMYMDSPVGEEERARLVAELHEAVSSAEKRELVLNMLDELVQADGDVSADEQAVVNEVKESLVNANVGLVGALSRLMRGRTEKRAQVHSTAPNRELLIDDYMHNRVYYRIQMQEQESGKRLDIPDEKLRRLSLAGGVMAQISRANPMVTDEEREVIIDALQEHWGLPEKEAEFVADIAISEPAMELDRFRLAREFASDLSHEEAIKFVDILFAIATADGHASIPEIEEIRHIAASLKLFHNEFIDAKMRVPRDKRSE